MEQNIPINQNQLNAIQVLSCPLIW